MSDAIRNLGINVWLWRVIIFKGFNNWFMVFTMSLCASNVASDFKLFSPKATAFLLAFNAGSKAIEAFLNQDLGRLKAEVASALSVTNQFPSKPQTETSDTKTS
jgi:hypothetical protein